ncbi:hypothetical protein PGB34_04460 [Xenophilus arseniciresistens]|uniref:Uncharacterized protein n=1 Tax=Xenophilus arseniciresistens TaxID=1283306 RepID=A0AAE3N5H0_9BURK|nr:hypothetical protein [Xenophilus arseniciresistens]MDA7415606.1 hypothetical protein [Xenophilus arseniciresistens]
MSQRFFSLPPQARNLGLLLSASALLSACTLPATAPNTGTTPPAAAATPAAQPAPPAPPALRPVEAEPQAPATQMQPRAPGPLSNMLAHADRVRSLSPADLSAEIARLGDAASAPGANPTLVMQHAIALAQTRNAPDLARALGLMQRVASDNSEAGLALQPLARLLAARYQEQRRVEEDRDRQAQQVKEAQRRIDQLTDRLEALRAIERSFGRPAPANGSTPRGAPPPH